MDEPPPSSGRGHRSLPHTADVIIEAWGPTVGDCFEEAVRGLVEGFVDSSNVAAAQTVPVSLGPGTREDLLVELLEEVVYLSDVMGVVPIAAAVEDAEDGGLVGSFDVVPVDRIEVAGAVPKAVSRSDLSVEQAGDGGWRCHVTIDV